MNVTLPITSRAALYLRVSTTRQADVDLSIPDQRLQTAAYCERLGWPVVAEYVEPVRRRRTTAGTNSSG